jgi:hypothetical protein
MGDVAEMINNIKKTMFIVNIGVGWRRNENFRGWSAPDSCVLSIPAAFVKHSFDFERVKYRCVCYDSTK